MVTVKQEEFVTLNDVSLIWTCIEPTIQQMRGKNFAVKSEAYAPLNPGQRALLMFQMLYGHTSRGIEEFYSHQSYLLSNEGVWLQLKKGMEYFGDYEMVHLLEKMETIYKELTTDEFNESVEQHNAEITEIDKNTELSTAISIINKSFSNRLPLSIKVVATYIRNNTNEFVQLID